MRTFIVQCSAVKTYHAYLTVTQGLLDTQSTHIPRVPQCLSPRIGTPPLLPQVSVSLPPPPKPSRDSGAHSPLGEGVGGGGVPSRTTGEKAQHSVYSVVGHQEDYENLLSLCI
jgi:hypothetical protein